MIDSIKVNTTSSMSSKRRRRPESPSDSPTTRRTVSFARSAHVKSIPPLSEMKKKEVKNLWFTDKEYWMIRQSLTRLIGKIIAGTYEHDINGLESEWRGLEKKTRKGSEERRTNRYIALVAVLDEQHRQKKQGQPVDSANIAILYRLSSSHCQREAIQLAANDAKLVREYQEQTPTESVTATVCAPKPSRKRISSTSSPSSPTPSPTPISPTVVCDDIKSPSRRRFSTLLLSSKKFRSFSPSRLAAQAA
jgi:hypothetical protein